jgi:hypothetical protein
MAALARLTKPILTALVALLVGCSSLGDNRFLAKNLDEKAKAKALTEAGIVQYQIRLVRKAEYAATDEIKEYFVVALRFDPASALAKKYLALVTNYREAKLQASLKEAARFAQKPKRTEEETYLLCLAVQRAVRIDPANSVVQKLLGDTTQARNALVDGYLARGKAALDKIDDKTPDAAREKLSIEAFQNVSRAITADPQSVAAQNSKNSLRAEVSRIAAGRLESAQKLIASQRFAEAKAQISLLNDLNRKLDNSFESDVRAASYTLNYRWAKALFDQKEYAQGEVKADAALAVKRTDEAAALKKRISDLRAQTETNTSFEAALQDIDRLIAKGELIAAQRKIDSLTKNTTGESKLASLDDRGEKVRANLKDLYDTGVGAYRDEDFKAAIELLETVVAIDEGYEQAADYLDKAQSKQELLEQF